MYQKNEKGEYVCPHCTKTTIRQNTMFYHIKNHTKDFDYKCSHCDKEFVQKSAILQHIQTNHPELVNPNSIYCPFCSQKTGTKGNTLIHIARVHADWIPVYMKNRCCSGCSKNCTSASSYYYHCIKCIQIDDTEFNNIVKNLVPQTS